MKNYLILPINNDKENKDISFDDAMAQLKDAITDATKRNNRKRSLSMITSKQRAYLRSLANESAENAQSDNFFIIT